MTVDTASWRWPQYAILVILALRFLIYAALHGKPMLDTDKQPARYNGFVAIFHFAIMLFILGAGGFFR